MKGNEVVQLYLKQSYLEFLVFVYKWAVQSFVGIDEEHTEREDTAEADKVVQGKIAEGMGGEGVLAEQGTQAGIVVADIVEDKPEGGMIEGCMIGEGMTVEDTIGWDVVGEGMTVEDMNLGEDTGHWGLVLDSLVDTYYSIFETRRNKIIICSSQVCDVDTLTRELQIFDERNF